MAAFAVASGVAVGMQVVQGRLKPAVIVTHLAVYGGIAGAAVGYRTADLAEART